MGNGWKNKKRNGAIRVESPLKKTIWGRLKLKTVDSVTGEPELSHKTDCLFNLRD